MVLLPPFSAQPFLRKNKRKEETRSPLIQTGPGFSLHLDFLAGGVNGYPLGREEGVGPADGAHGGDLP